MLEKFSSLTEPTYCMSLLELGFMAENLGNKAVEIMIKFEFVNSASS